MLPRVPAWYAAMLGAIRIGAVPMPGHEPADGEDIAYRIRHGGRGASRSPTARRRRQDRRDRARTCPSLRAPDRLGRRRRATGGTTSTRSRRRPATARRPTDPTAHGRPDAPLLHERHGLATRRWCCTRSPTGSATSSPRASGRTCARATCTGRSPTPAGRRRPGAGCSASGTSARPSSRSRSASPTPTRSSRILASHGITSFCAPPTLYRLLVQADLAALRPVRAAPLHERRRAAQPRGHPGLGGGHRRPDGLRRLRPDRDDVPRRQLPLACRCGRARWASRCPAATSTSSTSDGERARRRQVGNIAVRVADPRPVGLFDGYHRDDDANAARLPRRLVLHRRQGRGATRTATSGSRAATTTSSRRAAYRIGPFEVESALIEHPAVAEAAVVGKDDPERTQIVTRVRDPRPAATRRGAELAAELQDHAKRADRAVQVPARDPLRRRAAEDGQRQDPPHRAPRRAQRRRLSRGQRPCQRGARFSRNARGPSCASSLR